MSFLDGPNGPLAYRRTHGDGPGVLWLGGFRSDMTGTKAAHLAAWAGAAGRAFLRFDYTGHGASGGRFEDGCISDWTADARAVLERLTDGAQILVGSSMGAWIASLLALAVPERVRALVLIAPAPDFTEALMLPAFTAAQRSALLKEGRIALPSAYGPEPDIITLRLIEDGRRNLVLPRAGEIRCPVRMLQGMKDEDVPWRHAAAFAERLGSDDVVATLTRGGDHRLSTLEDLNRMVAAVESV